VWIRIRMQDFFRLFVIAWWCSGYDVGLATQRVAVRLPAVPLSGYNLRQVVHTHVPLVTYQYKLVLIKRR